MATIDSLAADVQTWTLTSNVGAPTVLSNAVATECVNAAMRRMARTRRWTFLQMSADLTIAGGTVNAAPLPPFFGEEIDVYTKATGTNDPASNLIPITKTLRSFWYSAINPQVNIDPQFPQVAAPALRSAVTDARYYYLWDGQLFIVPTPSAQITVTLDYVASSDLAFGLSPAQQNGFTTLYADAVRIGALREASLFLHEWEIAERHEVTFLKRLGECVSHDNAQESGGASRQRGV